MCPKLQCLYIFLILCPFLQEKRRAVPTFLILYIINQVYSACVIQCTIKIFHNIINLKFRNDNILAQTFFSIFVLHFFFFLRMFIQFLGEYIIHLNCQCERGVIHTKIMYLCFSQTYNMYIALQFFRFLFRSIYPSAF